MTTFQEPKYDVNSSGELYNRQTGIAIPSDEPVFILRAKDVLAVEAMRHYHAEYVALQGWDTPHSKILDRRIQEFLAFAKAHPDRMKVPDTDAEPPRQPSCACNK